MGPYSGVSESAARNFTLSLCIRFLHLRASSFVNLDNFESREVWLQSRVKHRVPETRDQRYERVKKERELRGKQVGVAYTPSASLLFFANFHCYTLLNTSTLFHFTLSLQLIEEREKFFKPTENPDSTKDPFKTLFVGRLAFVTDEVKLKREFEE
jgi:hypothetical protein